MFSEMSVEGPGDLHLIARRTWPGPPGRPPPPPGPCPPPAGGGPAGWTSGGRPRRTSSSGATTAGRRDMMLRTGTDRGSSSAATHRSTMSRSVTIPWSSPPRPAHRQGAPRCAGPGAGPPGRPLSVGSMDTTWGFIMSRTCIKTTSFPFPIVWAESQADIHGKDVLGEADRESGGLSRGGAAPPLRHGAVSSLRARFRRSDAESPAR